jgi:hypothetical protein
MVAVAIFAVGIVAVIGAIGWSRWATNVITGRGSQETPKGEDQLYYSFNQMRPDYYQAELLLRRDGSFQHRGSLEFSGTYEMSSKDGTLRLLVKSASKARFGPGKIIDAAYTTIPVPGEGVVKGLHIFVDYEVYLPMRSHEAVLASRLRIDEGIRQARAKDERALAERSRRNAAANTASSPSIAPSGPSEGYSGADPSAQVAADASIDALYTEGEAIISNVLLEAQTLMAGGNGLDPGNLSNGIFDFSSKLAPALRCAQQIDSLASQSTNAEAARNKARDLRAKIDDARRKLAQLGIR